MIGRRHFMLGSAASFALSQPATAELACQNFPGFRTCTVGVAIDLNTARQECMEWCWAACVEGVFAFHSHPVSQERIVEKVFGAAQCQSAIGPQIVGAINGKWTDDAGDSFSASAEVLWDTQFFFGRPDAIIVAARELEANNPLILGALGHATVMTAMTYSGNGSAVQINQVVVRDPWPYSPNRRVLSPVEAMATQFLASVRVS